MGRGKKERGTESQARERISDQRKPAAILKDPPRHTQTHTHTHTHTQTQSEREGENKGE